MAQDYYVEKGLNPEVQALWSFNPDSLRVPMAATQGVLTQISRPSGGVISGQGVVFDNDGSPGKSLGMYGELKPNQGKEDTHSRGKNWSLLHTLFAETHLLIKNPGALNSGKANLMTNSLEKLKAMIPILKGETPFVLAMDRAQDMRNLITMKESQKAKWGYSIRPMVLGGAESWKVAKVLAKHNIPVILSPARQTPMSMDMVHARFDLAASLNKENVKVLLDDSGGTGATRLRQEAGLAVKYGMPKEAALLAISKNPAQAFDLQRGELQVGAAAHMVLWSADPLEPTSVAQKVWIHGKSQPLETRHSLLAKKYLKK